MDIGDGMYDCDTVVLRTSKVAFEWCFQSRAGHVQQYIVTPQVTDVAKMGVPAPDCFRKTKASLVDLARCATEAAARASGQLQERLGWPDMNVNCRYMGITGASGIDFYAPRLPSSTAVFEWTIHASECDWKEEVRAKIRDCNIRSIPLPSCNVTHGRLQDAAHATSQAASDLFGYDISCVYPDVCL